MIGVINHAIHCNGVHLGEKDPRAHHSNLPPELAIICFVGAHHKENYAIVIRDSITECKDGEDPVYIEMTVNIKSRNVAVNWARSAGVWYDYRWMLVCGQITE